MMRHDELDKAFDLAIARSVPGAETAESRATKTIGYLGKAIVRLDKTSGRLSFVNIALTFVILVVGVVQIALMLKGK